MFKLEIDNGAGLVANRDKVGGAWEAFWLINQQPDARRSNEGGRERLATLLFFFPKFKRIS
ncbi:hypothetical protein J53TS2_07260 [Paenibacillus sp. J53TS2]|nr:hypothetical protein J53TS2_07260 [Paenibacillus sp. J53TS2]